MDRVKIGISDRSQRNLKVSFCPCVFKQDPKLSPVYVQFRLSRIMLHSQS